MLPDLFTEDFYKQLKRDIYKDSYYEFFKDAYKELHPGQPYSDNWHIKYLCDTLQDEALRIKDFRVKTKDVIINIPFRSAKSMITTIIFPVWCWVVYPRMKFICTSFSGGLALEHASLSRTLMYSQWFRDLYGDSILLSDDDNQKGFYRNKEGGYRKSVGMGGQITGSGCDIAIIDDPQDPRMSASEVERKNVINFYNNVLYNRLNQPDMGVRIIVMQRLAEDDLSGYLLAHSPNRHRHICIPVAIHHEIDQKNLSPKELQSFYKDNLFWPDRFSESVIEDFVHRLGTREAAGQLFQRPAPEEGNMVKKEWFDIIDSSKITLDLINSPIIFYIDTAETEKQTGDATAILAAFKQGNDVYIFNVIEVRKQFSDLVKFIPEFVAVNKYTQNSKIKIEPKSSGKSVVSQLRTATNLNIVELVPPKDSKITRLNAISPLLESRRVKFIDGIYTENFMNQLLTFPNSKNDDMVDVFIYCITDLLMDNDFDFSFI